MSRTSASTDDVRCGSCSKCLARNDAIKCSRCDTVTPLRPNDAYVIAHALGAGAVIFFAVSGAAPYSVSIEPRDFVHGRIETTPPDTVLPNRHHRLRQFIAQALVSQSITRYPAINGLQHAMDEADRIVTEQLGDKVMSVPYDRRGQKRSDLAMALMRDAKDEVEVLIDEHFDTIERLARTLLEKNAMGAEEMREFFAQR